MPSNHSWSFTTGMAPDTTPPSVTATTPAAGEGTVGVNAVISFTFSEPVEQTTILFDLSAGEVHAAGALAYSDTTATFTPSGPLNYSTLYTGTVSAGVKDLAGNAMPSNHSWSFTTGMAPDTTPPSVTATTPAAGEGTVGVNAVISFTFSEPVEQTTILFDLSAGEVHAAGALAYSDTTAAFTPLDPLNSGTFYTATVSAVVKDLAGNAMPGDYSWSFTTQ
jgi:methionine-rich copper-binding protein CopC